MSHTILTVVLNKDIILHSIEKLVSVEKPIECTFLSEKYFCSSRKLRVEVANFSSFLLDSFALLLANVILPAPELEEPHHIISFKPFFSFQPSKNIHSGLTFQQTGLLLDCPRTVGKSHVKPRKVFD